MGGCLILECMVLFHWCERNGYGPLGVTGLSMGGHMASLAATNWPKPIVLVPCLSWSSAAPVFTTGVMSHSINWDMLESQYYSNGTYSERLSKMVTVIDDAFNAGQKFIQDFNQSLKELEKDINETRYKSLFENIFKSVVRKNSGPTIEKCNSIGARNCFYEKGISQLIFETNEINAKKKSKNNYEVENFKTSQDQSTLTKLMEYILPKTSLKQTEKIDIKKTNWWEREALQFMRGMMDECTHLKNFSVPFDTSLIIAVCAKDDAYVPREGCSSLEDIWPGVEVRYLDAGHISAYVLHQKLFRSCIIEAFERAKTKCEKMTETVGEDLKPGLSYSQLINKYTNSMLSTK